MESVARIHDKGSGYFRRMSASGQSKDSLLKAFAKLVAFLASDFQVEHQIFDVQA